MISELATNIAFELIAKSAIVIVLVAICVAAFRKASATTRHALWLSAIALLIVMPMATIALPSVSIPVLPPRATTVVTSAAAEPPLVIEAPGTITVDNAPAATPTTAPRNAAANSMRWPLNTWLFLVWLIGVSMIALRAAVGLIGVARLQRNAETVTDETWNETLSEMRREMGVQRHIALIRSLSVPVPMTWGLVRPRICLPADSCDWTESKQRIVLSHELAHVRRGDWLWQLIATAATALHWFNPLAWWAARRLRSEAETACDDSVIQHGCRPVDYADCLYELVRDSRAPRPAFTLAVAMARRTELPERLTMILNHDARRSPIRFRTLAIVLGGVMLAGTLIATAQLDRARADEPAPKKAATADNPLLTDAHRSAIKDGLDYLLTQQRDDGGVDDPKGVRASTRTGATALALLALLAHDGPDPDGRYKKAIDAAVEYLSATQNADGQFGARNANESMYSHGFALLALTKAYEANRDEKLKPIIKRAVKLIVDAQNKTGGWRYRANSTNADSSVVSCLLVPLAAAHAAGFDVPDKTYEEAIAYLVRCQTEDGGFRYQAESGRSGVARTAASVAALIATRGDNKTIADGAKYLIGTLGEDIKAHRGYADYYRSLVFGTMDADRFTDWYEPNAEALVTSQAADGSWDHDMGQEVSTAMALIVLQSPNKRLRLARRPRVAARVGAALPAKFVGTWQPLSRNHDSILGEMRVAADRVVFKRKGASALRILRAGDDEVVVKLAEDLEGSGPFMRLGPIERKGDHEQIEIAFYENEKKALAKRTDRIGGASSWGVYLRPVDEARPAGGR